MEPCKICQQDIWLDQDAYKQITTNYAKKYTPEVVFYHLECYDSRKNELKDKVNAKILDRVEEKYLSDDPDIKCCLWISKIAKMMLRLKK